MQENALAVQAAFIKDMIKDNNTTFCSILRYLQYLKHVYFEDPAVVVPRMVRSMAPCYRIGAGLLEMSGIL